MAVKSLKNGEILEGLSEFEERVAVAHGVAECVIEEEKQLVFPKADNKTKEVIE